MPNLRAGRVDHANAFGHHFLADAVTGDDGDALLAHGGSCQPQKRRIASSQLPPSSDFTCAAV
jgi:hypothetical protein